MKHRWTVCLFLNLSVLNPGCDNLKFSSPSSSSSTAACSRRPSLTRSNVPTPQLSTCHWSMKVWSVGCPQFGELHQFGLKRPILPEFFSLFLLTFLFLYFFMYGLRRQLLLHRRLFEARQNTMHSYHPKMCYTSGGKLRWKSESRLHMGRPRLAIPISP